MSGNIKMLVHKIKENNVSEYIDVPCLYSYSFSYKTKIGILLILILFFFIKIFY